MLAVVSVLLAICMSIRLNYGNQKLPSNEVDFTGMVINDSHTVDLPGNTVFRDVCNVTGVSLPHFSKGILFKGLPVTEIRVSGRFQVVAAYKTLYGIHTDSGRNETVLYEFLVDLCCIDTWKILFDSKDLQDCFVV